MTLTFLFLKIGFEFLEISGNDKTYTSRDFAGNAQNSGVPEILKKP
jgi:hypothetical protein